MDLLYVVSFFEYVEQNTMKSSYVYAFYLNTRNYKMFLFKLLNAVIVHYNNIYPYMHSPL